MSPSTVGCCTGGCEKVPRKSGITSQSARLAQNSLRFQEGLERRSIHGYRSGTATEWVLPGAMKSGSLADSATIDVITSGTISAATGNETLCFEQHFIEGTENLEIDVTKFGLGTFIVKFEMPMNFIDDINRIYEDEKELPKHNQNLAGKIKDELRVTEILTNDMKDCFWACFRQYLQVIGKPLWHCELAGAWINDMKANEYNPFHYHQSTQSYLGLSSVLVLKRPSTYGVEYSREETPCNGWLEFSGGQQDPLVALKSRELDLKAMDMQRKERETELRAQLDMTKEANRLDFQYDKLSEQSDQSDQRLQVAREKLAKK